MRWRRLLSYLGGGIKHLWNFCQNILWYCWHFWFFGIFGGLIYPCTEMNWACVNVHISYIIDILHDLHKHATSYLQDVTRIRVHITDQDGNLEHHHHQNGMICSLSYDPLSLMITLKSIHNTCWPMYNLLDWGNKTKTYLYTVNLILLNTFFHFSLYNTQKYVK